MVEFGGIRHYRFRRALRVMQDGWCAIEACADACLGKFTQRSLLSYVCTFGTRQRDPRAPKVPACESATISLDSRAWQYLGIQRTFFSTLTAEFSLQCLAQTCPPVTVAESVEWLHCS